MILGMLSPCFILSFFSPSLFLHFISTSEMVSPMLTTWTTILDSMPKLFEPNMISSRTSLLITYMSLRTSLSSAPNSMLNSAVRTLFPNLYSVLCASGLDIFAAIAMSVPLVISLTRLSMYYAEHPNIITYLTVKPSLNPQQRNIEYLLYMMGNTE